MSVSVGVRMYFSMQSEDQRPYVLMSQAGSLAAPLQLLFKSCGRHIFRKLFAAEGFAVLVRKERAIDWRVLYRSKSGELLRGKFRRLLHSRLFVFLF